MTSSTINYYVKQYSVQPLIQYFFAVHKIPHIKNNPFVIIGYFKNHPVNTCTITTYEGGELGL